MFPCVPCSLRVGTAEVVCVTCAVLLLCSVSCVRISPWSSGGPLVCDFNSTWVQVGKEKETNTGMEEDQNMLTELQGAGETGYLWGFARSP